MLLVGWLVSHPASRGSPRGGSVYPGRLTTSRCDGFFPYRIRIRLDPITALRVLQAPTGRRIFGLIMEGDLWRRLLLPLTALG